MVAKVLSNSFVILFLSSLAHAYWRMTCGTVQTGRIDPVVSPGKVSTHVHKISGASNIGISSTYQQLIDADCTSCSVQDDKSAYWTPLLYYQHANGSFEEVPNYLGTVVYYLGRGDNRTTIKPFPEGFRMLSGNMLARSYDNTDYTFGGTAGMTLVNGTCDGNGTCTSGVWTNGTVPGGPQYYGRPLGDRVSYKCLGSDNEAETPGLENMNCPDGLRAQLQFQSCWDGVNLYKSDNSHVAYMSQIDNGICPPGYPVQLIHLFFEVIYNVNSIVQDGGQFVFAHGDPTGYGFHGDFLNGWNMTTLTNALTQCANTDNNGQITACAPLMLSNSDEAPMNCPEQPPVVAEPVHGMLPSLPGCITIAPGPGLATIAEQTCPASVPPPVVNPTPTASGPRVTFLPTVGQTYNKWKYLGCANETAPGTRTLSGPTFVGNNMTNEICQSFCAKAGMPLAGVEYGNQCYCGLSLNSTSTFGQDCTSMICAGNRSEMCGGPDRVSVWNSTTYTGPYSLVPHAVGVQLKETVGAKTGVATYKGCAPDNGAKGGTRALSTASYIDKSAMTIDSCIKFCAGKKLKLAGMEFTDECYCANALGGGSVLGKSTACTLACVGNATEVCGGAYAVGVWDVSTLY